MKRIYLDHAAGSPLRAGARAAMLPLLESANASSLHAPGRSARAAVDRARDTVAKTLGCLPREVVFTSSGTEANAAALLGLARASAGPKRLLRSSVEHSAVRAACDALIEEAGWEVEELAVDGDGRLAPATLAAALERRASLVSVMLANNEIGTIQPIAELAALAETGGAIFHCDAVQAPGSLPIAPAGYGIDAMSLGASKFGGPQGCGILYLRSGVPFRPALAGSQEAGRRAGTENVAAIAGAAAALEEAEAGRAAEAARLSALRDRFEAEIARSIDDIAFPGQAAPRLPGISSVAFRGVENQALLVGLDLAGVAVSTGSACAAGSAEPSHVLRAIGAPEWAVRGVIRFSIGHSTTEEDVTDVLRMLPSVVGSVRGFAPSEVST